MKKKNRLFSEFQKVGSSLMLPIAVLPAAGLMMGIGYLFTNQTLLSIFPFLGEGGWLAFAKLLQQISGVIFSNLPLLFAIGVASSLSKNDGAAGLSSALGLIVMYMTIGYLLNIDSELIASDGTRYTSIMGINTLQMGPIVGALVGYITSIVYRRFHNVKLPVLLSFFSGKRCLPIIMSIVGILLGCIFSVVWPPIQNALNSFANLMVSPDGNVNLLMLAIITFANNFLLLFGLHHCIYTIFFYQLGTYTTLAGTVVTGDANIYFAQLADGITPTAGVYGSFGFYILCMFIYPAIMLAIYKCAEKKDEAKSICLSAGFTAFLTGITEPACFSFAISALPLWFVMHLITAIASVTVVALGGHVATAFCGGLFDFTFDCIIPGAPNWIVTIIVGLIAAVIMYFVAVFMINKFNFSTPGRNIENNVKDILGANLSDEELYTKILKALGGKENIDSLSSCFTRLRVTVKKYEEVDIEALKKISGTDCLVKGNNIQVIFGTKVEQIKDGIISLMESI